LVVKRRSEGPEVGVVSSRLLVVG